MSYAKITWTAADVQTLAPKMTTEEAEAWLIENESHLRDRLIELGWSVIESLLSFDGVDTSDVETDLHGAR